MLVFHAIICWLICQLQRIGLGDKAKLAKLLLLWPQHFFSLTGSRLCCLQTLSVKWLLWSSMFLRTEEPLSCEILHLCLFQRGYRWQEECPPHPISQVSQSLVAGCLESGGIPVMPTISANIDKFLSSGRGESVHTHTHAQTRTDTHTHRLGCYCWLVSNPHLWMVTRASGLQYSHSYLTDSRDQFPWAEEWRRVTW